MIGEIHRLRDKPGETEKITINVGFVDLGHIDLLLREGFYSNRTDFIRTAIRNQLGSHADAAKQSITRHALELGSTTVQSRRFGGGEGRGRQAAHSGGRACDNRRRCHPRTRAGNNRVCHCTWRFAGEQSGQGGAF